MSPRLETPKQNQGVDIAIICLFCGEQGEYDEDAIARCGRCRDLMRIGDDLYVAPWIDDLEGPIVKDV